MAVVEAGGIERIDENGGGHETGTRSKILKQKKPEVVVVIAGSSRSGKSTALNNIFYTDFDDEYSTYSVTKKVHMRRLVGLGSDMILVDTPGIGATDIPVGRVKKELLNAIGSLRFVLIYCYSVGPGNPQSKTDEIVAKNLQKVLGKKIWEKCVIFFTFSDLIRDHVYPTANDRYKYKEAINKHATRLSKLFRDVCGSHVPDIKTVFEVNLDQENITEIVAVPIGLKKTKIKEKYELVPDINDTNWLTLAQLEVIRKAEKMERETYLHHVQMPSKIGTAAGAAIGGVIGAAGGGVLGAATLGLALAPAVVAGTAMGVALGGVAGGVVGTTGGLSMGEVKYRLYASRNEKMIQDAPVYGYQQPQPQLGEETTASDRNAKAKPINISLTQQIKPEERPKTGETPISYQDQEIAVRPRCSTESQRVSKEIPEEYGQED